VVDEGGPRFASAGTCTGAPPFAATESTLYEIGSISKVFTTSLLAVLEAEGRVAEGDTLSRVLPEARLSRGVGAMSLVDLATHTSGMPRMPTNWIAPDRSQPRAPYDRAELFAFLGSFTPSRPPGARFEYSNVGSGVLGVALAAAAESSYEDLLTSRLLGPLGLGETHLLVPDDARARMALGQDGSGVAIFPRRYMPVLAGCCALQSSARDLARFVGAHLGWAPTAIAEALRRTHAVRRPLSRGEHPVLGGEGVALGWFVREGVRWHGGVTGGWATFVAFDPSLGIGVVVLRNRSAEEPVRDAGFALLAELALGVSPSGPADETAAAEGPGTPRTTP
jgi:CubicO group peptidase (beta-lactamase class C family)